MEQMLVSIREEVVIGLDERTSGQADEWMNRRDGNREWESGGNETVRTFPFNECFR